MTGMSYDPAGAGALTRVAVRIIYTVSTLGLRGDDQPVDFDYDGAHGIKVDLRPMTSDEVAQGFPADSAFATAEGSYELTATLGPIFRALAEDRFPIDGAKIDDAFLDDKVDEQGRLLGGFAPPPSWLGEEFISFERAVRSELADWLFRTIRVP